MGEINYRKQHFSTRIYRALLVYLQKNFPDVDLAKILRGFNLPPQYLENETNWVSIDFARRFTLKLIEETGDKHISYNAGHQTFTPDVIGLSIYHLTRLLIPIPSLYKQVPKLLPQFSRLTRIEILNDSQSTIMYRFSFIDSFLSTEERKVLREHESEILQNTIGYLASIPTIRGRQPAKVSWERIEREGAMPFYDIRIEWENERWAQVPIIRWLLFLSGLGCAYGMLILNVPTLLIVTYITFLTVSSIKINERQIATDFQKLIENLNHQNIRYAELLVEEQKNYELQRSYKRFVPRNILEALRLNSTLELTTQTASKGNSTTMYLDLRGFTGLMERYPPEHVLKLLNTDFLPPVMETIEEHNGWVVDIIADAVLASFYRSADDAVNAAFRIVSKLDKINYRKQNTDEPAIRVGIGISTGANTIGVLGVESRIKPTILSDKVNVAARLEKLTKELKYPILLEEETANSLSQEMQRLLIPLGKKNLQGKENQSEIFALETQQLRLKVPYH